MLKLRGSITSSGSPLQCVNFDVGSDCDVGVNHFNPLEQFDHLGKKKLDQVCHCLLSFDSNRSLIYLDKICFYFVALPIVERCWYYDVLGWCVFLNFLPRPETLKKKQENEG